MNNNINIEEMDYNKLLKNICDFILAIKEDI